MTEEDVIYYALVPHTSDHAWAMEVAELLAPQLRNTKAEAWDEGFDAGHETARAVNPEWPNRTANPYRGGE